MLRHFEAAPLALYIHIPFCRSRCSYCAFNTYAGLESLIPDYISAMCREIAWLGQRMGCPQLRSIYMGGGTPSILDPNQIGGVLLAAEHAFTLTPETEISIECNPTGVDRGYFSAIRACGVNRLSMGAQTAHADELRMFGRQHVWEDIPAAVMAARQGGFENISLDLIYGAPGQTLSRWHETLQKTAACDPEHISLYALSLEPGTALYRQVEKGRREALNADITADMYDLASDFLGQAGYQHYEISNWARPGYECVHNLQYWRRKGGYLAVGAGAYGYLDQVRYGVVDSVDAYISQIERACLLPHASAPDLLSLAEDPDKSEVLPEQAARSETMILGLRLLREGVQHAAFVQRFGRVPEAYYPEEIGRLLKRDMIAMNSTCITLRPHAWLIANQVMVEFV